MEKREALERLSETLPPAALGSLSESLRIALIVEEIRSLGYDLFLGVGVVARVEINKAVMGSIIRNRQKKDKRFLRFLRKSGLKSEEL